VRRKRLQHAADILCRMFCGWRLAKSYRSLASHGTGTLRIDALAGSCAFDGVGIESLPIAEELQLWLRGEIAGHRIPREGLCHAILTVQITFRAMPPGKRMANERYLGRDGKVVYSSEFHSCTILCEAEIATNETVYRSCHADVTEWPEDWP
jgi:hypothetical protein